MLVYKGLNRVFIHDDIEKLKKIIENDYDIIAATNSNISYKVEKYLAATGLSDPGRRLTGIAAGVGGALCQLAGAGLGVC